MSYITLADLSQAAAPAPVWQPQVQPISDAATKPDWPTVTSLAKALAQKTKTTNAIPVATAAQHVVDSASALAAGKGPASDVSSNIDDLMSAAQSEDVATDSDRLLSAQMIDKQIDGLVSDIAAWSAANSGFKVLWDKIRGGFDTSSLTTEVTQIQAAIDTTPLSAVGRKELTARLTQTAATIPTGLDWSTAWWAVAATGGVLALNWGITKAQTHAATKAAEFHKKIVKKFTKKKIKKKLKKPETPED